jgi:hypothetical protein
MPFLFSGQWMEAGSDSHSESSSRFSTQGGLGFRVRESCIGPHLRVSKTINARHPDRSAAEWRIEDSLPIVAFPKYPQANEASPPDFSCPKSSRANLANNPRAHEGNQRAGKMREVLRLRSARCARFTPLRMTRVEEVKVHRLMLTDSI